MSMVRVTKETKAHIQYVMGALRCNQREMAFYLGLSPATVSRLLKDPAHRLHYRVHSRFYPRLVAMVERADRGRGVPALLAPESKMMNPPSTVESKEFITGPLREKVTLSKSERARAKYQSPEYREKHRVAMNRYWDRRRSREAAYKLKEIRAAENVINMPVTATIPPINIIPVVKKLGFFARLIRLLVP